MSRQENAYLFLANALRKAIHGEVHFDDGSRALYAADASNYRQVPIGVVIPKTIEDVIQTVAVCREFGAPILSRGAGTSLAGQACNAAVILDFSRHLNQILEINPQKKIARVQPGVILDDLRREAKKYGLTFGPDPATHSRCTIGGMIGNNSCGVHSVMAGKTAENTEALEILTYDGQRMRVGKTLDSQASQNSIYVELQKLRDRYADLIRKNYPKLPRRVSGYNLEELLPENEFQVARALVGTEGTCVLVLEAELKLIEDPAFRSLVVLGYPDIYQAADHVSKVLSFKPIGVEALDEFYVQNMRSNQLHLQEIADLPPGQGWLLVEFGGKTQKDAEEQARHMIKALEQERPAPKAKCFTDPREQKRIWSLRESSFGATVFVPGVPDTFSGFEDSAVPPEKLGAYLRELRKLYDAYGYYAVTYGHFGDGCIHTRISFDLKSDQGIETYKRFLEEAADLVVKFGGSFSGEHGDGQTWGHLLYKMYGHELVQAFREFKRIWDPGNKMNPGKVVDSFGPDKNLRLKHYASFNQGKLNFNYGTPSKGTGFTRNPALLEGVPDSSFARETERCIGIGKCLNQDEGVMCPSYRATREEKHSPRGRAHLLHEMMRGEVIKEGWQSEEAKEALDLCLACKACKSECPVKVDMASYKAEFLSHYYQGKARPISAYVFGMINRWAEIASRIPWFFNFLSQTPGFKEFTKWMSGIALERQLPAFANQTFKDWFKSRGSGTVSKSARSTGNPALLEMVPEVPEVILWPDTFTNSFYPEVGKAAVEVLEYAGFQVKLPFEGLCCGRPLYDSGMLGLAKEYLEKILLHLKDDLEKGVCVIGLEPSCIAVFKDELPQFFPDNPLAKKLQVQSFLLAEFLEKKAGHTVWPSFPQEMMVQGHCHQQALVGMESEKKILDKLGAAYKILDSGCCGMAGGFGFEKEHYEVSVKCAERVLLPEIKKAGKETLIVSDGFSCREQIRQLLGRRPLHLAEVLQQAIQKLI